MKIASTLFAAAAMSGCLLASAGAPSADRKQPAVAAEAAVAAIPAVANVEVAAAPNCLLPGQIRSFGSLTLLTPRRAVTLAAADCAARGGEPITTGPLAN